MTPTVRWLALPNGTSAARLDEMARQAGLSPTASDDADLTVGATWSSDPDLGYDPASPGTTERFRLVLPPHPGEETQVNVTGDRSLRWALIDLVTRLRRRQWDPGEHVGGPAFAVRGIIEGFYGTPWSHPERLDMIEFASRHRMNAFLYAPKDDPHLRRRWREPHHGESRERLIETVAHGTAHGVDPIVGVSPGLSMRYSSDDDRKRLDAKLADIAGIGVTRLALLLDDIPDQLQHPADIDRFPDLVTAHIELANRVSDHLDARLIVCPTRYWGHGTEEYIARLGAELDPRIDLFWTGRAICSPEISLDDAAVFTRTTHRPPLFWDNYPVNDVGMSDELHIGPYLNRDRHLHRFSGGIMANAMEHPEASKIALATIADYLWDPEGYQPEVSWREALAEVGGAEDAAALALFADNVRASCLSPPDPVRLTAAIERFTFELHHGNAAAARSELADFAAELATAADRLLGSRAENPKLQEEMRPWLRKFRRGASAVDAVARHAVADGSPTPQGLVELTAAHLELTADRHRVFGDVLDMTLADLIAPDNHIG